MYIEATSIDRMLGFRLVLSKSKHTKCSPLCPNPFVSKRISAGSKKKSAIGTKSFVSFITIAKKSNHIPKGSCESDGTVGCSNVLIVKFALLSLLLPNTSCHCKSCPFDKCAAVVVYK